VASATPSIAVEKTSNERFMVFSLIDLNVSCKCHPAYAQAQQHADDISPLSCR